MGLGKHVETSVVERVMQAQTPNQCASLVYTVSPTVLVSITPSCTYLYLQSGTTGNPKGTMLSHDNVSHAVFSSASSHILSNVTVY